jgi:predicted nucleic acid-binding protein
MKTQKNKLKNLLEFQHNKQKVIIFDASTLISFAMACLYGEFRKLKQNFNGKFLITQDVKMEVIDKPLTIKRFQLEALKIQQLMDDEILEIADSLGINNKEISGKTFEMMEIANSSFVAKGKEMKLIDKGEASCLALSQILTRKNIENVVAIDERTMRLFCENPKRLKKYLEKKMNTSVKSKKNNFEIFNGFKIIRSIELIYIAYKKGLVGRHNKKWLTSLIYALRFKGCSISNEELDEIQSMG